MFNLTPELYKQKDTRFILAFLSRLVKTSRALIIANLLSTIESVHLALVKQHFPIHIGKIITSKIKIENSSRSDF